jgi:hypothetical protein
MQNMNRHFYDDHRQIQPQWVGSAERLRTVRRACRLFLDCWALSHIAGDPNAVQRMASDVRKAGSNISESDHHDWSILYRGSVLDD